MCYTINLHALKPWETCRISRADTFRVGRFTFHVYSFQFSSVSLRRGGGVPIVVKALSICIQAQTKSAFLQKWFLSNFSNFYLLKISSWRLGNVDRMDQVPGDVRRRERNQNEAM